MQGFCHANLPHLSLISDYYLSATPGASRGSSEQAQTRPKQPPSPLSSLKEGSRGPSHNRIAYGRSLSCQLIPSVYSLIIIYLQPRGHPLGPQNKPRHAQNNHLPLCPHLKRVVGVPPIVKLHMEGFYHAKLSRLSNHRLSFICDPGSTPQGPKISTDTLKTTTSKKEVRVPQVVKLLVGYYLCNRS